MTTEMLVTTPPPVAPSKSIAPLTLSDPRHADAHDAPVPDPQIAILGLGYVGLPTGLAAAAAGLPVIGIDASPSRLRRVRSGNVDLLPRDHDRLRESLATGALRLAANARVLADADVVLICVPTPVDEDRSPDLRMLRSACETVVQHARHGQTLVLTSTSYVGTTAELLVDPLRARGFRVGEDVHVAFSPERIDPGNAVFAQEDVPRVVGGATEACAERASEVLGRLARHIHRVSSLEAAELTKLYENTFRAVNIAFAYEMADAAAHYGVDPIEVTDAAATKPFGFMAFYPGAGVGGHCIPCDPHYLLSPLARAGRSAPMIGTAMDAIAGRPARVVERALGLLGEPRGKRVLVVGVAYKPGVEDVRESPAVEIIAALKLAGCEVGYHDPLVGSFVHDGGLLHCEQAPSGADWELAIVTTARAGEGHAFLHDFPAVLDATYRGATGAPAAVHTL